MNALFFNSEEELLVGVLTISIFEQQPRIRLIISIEELGLKGSSLPDAGS